MTMYYSECNFSCMKSPIYIISDNHFQMNLSKPEVERRIKMYSVFDKIKSTGGSLIIAGDFFDFWFDYPNVIPPFYTEILNQLSELRNSGVDIHYILGNHDYWDFGYLQEECGITTHDGALMFELDGKTFHITHGDGLLSWDKGYRFMKKIIRSNMCIFLFKLYPAKWGCWLAGKVSGTDKKLLRNTPHPRNEKVRDEVRNYAKTEWKNGTDIVMVGHYHQTGIEEKNGKHLVFLGDWLHNYTITKWDELGLWQGNWEEIV